MAVPIRARDLRANIKDYGFEQGIVVTIEALLDEHAETRQHLREVVDLLDKCIDEVRKFNQIGHGMRQTIEQIKRDRDNEESREPL